MIAKKALFDLAEGSDGQLVAVGGDGYLFSKLAGEEEWVFHRSKHWDILTKIVVKPDGGYLAAGGKSYEKGYIYHINKSIEVDSVQYFGHEISDIALVSDSTWMTVGWGNIQRSTDNGRTWRILPIEGDLFGAIVFANATLGWIIGVNGTLLQTTDGGLTWEDVDIDAPKFDVFRSIEILEDRSLVILGTKGRLWRSQDSGDTWEAFRLDRNEDILGIKHLDNNRYLVYGTSGFLSEIRL
jgi:photosystem II stability/assembly factor-like uncharacterized protein